MVITPELRGALREPRATAALFIGMIRSDHHIAAVLTGKTISRPAVKRCLAAAVETLMRGAVIESDSSDCLEKKSG